MESNQLKELIVEMKEVRKIVEDNHKGLFNHISHLEADTKVLQAEISWLKEMKDDFKVLREYIFTNRPQKEIGEDKKQDANIDWLSFFVRASVTAGISAMVAIITALLLK